MSMSDPIADMLTRIRNANMAGHTSVSMPSSKMKIAIANILKDEGYIEDYFVTQEEGKPQASLQVKLKYIGERRTRRSVLTGVERVSKPGRRIYAGKREIPWVLSGMGISIVSTPKGVMSDRRARRLGVGGEIICKVW